MASQIDLGAVVPIGKGDWDSGTTYERANIVRYNSTAWVCKVETSIGVEPTEDSSDWYLLVKDTSGNSVTSVNGMKGDVKIDSIIENPESNDNSLKIASTSWVQENLNTLSESVQSNINEIQQNVASITEQLPTDASTTNKGIVQLSSSLDSDSETTAATSKAVQQLNDKIKQVSDNLDYWDIYPPYSPLPIWTAKLGGSDGRRAIMPGEEVAREEWIVCDGGSDGKSGTVPDIRGKYIRGVSESEPEGTIGGSEDIAVDLSGSTGATTLNTSQMPSHTHPFSAVVSMKGRYMEDGNLYDSGSSNTSAAGGNGSHTHPLSGSVSGTHTDPHIAMYYFIKII